jgi:hypothetical protein
LELGRVEAKVVLDGLIDDNFLTQLRAKVAEAFKQPEELLCLIFSGKIMKNEETLLSHKLADGFVVHLVIKSSAAARGPQDPASSSSSSSAAPRPAEGQSQTRKFVCLYITWRSLEFEMN